MKLKQPTLLKDALYNTNPNSGSSVEYGRGIIIGVVSGLMSVRGIAFSKAVRIVKENMPARFNRECIPDTWSDIWDRT